MEKERISSERLSELRQLIRAEVSSEHVQGRIRECVSDVEREDGGVREESLLRLLEEKGLVDQVMSGLKLEKETPLQRKYPTMTNGESSILHDKLKDGQSNQCIYFQVLGGRAFLDHIDKESCPLTTPTSTFTIHLYFRGQRFCSSPVPCSCDPEFEEGFLLQLDERGKGLRPSDTLSISDQIHIVLTQSDRHGDNEVIGTCIIEWRSVLFSPRGKVSHSVELTGLRTEGQIPPGVLNLQWELMPRGDSTLKSDIVEAQLHLEHQRMTERKKMFLLYAKQWWKEYLGIRPNHSQRLVKIFAEDETGRSNVVCHFVRPLRVEWLLDGPRHAARFVSLLRYHQTTSVGGGGGGGEMWRRLHSILATKSGGCEDHSILLCSLLLGYGLDSYVCLGTKVKGLAHCWVMTCNINGSVIFWESLTGQRFFQSTYDPNTQAGTPLSPPSHPYRTIGCVFNHKSFYANVQPSDNVLTCQFDLHNGSSWKSMSMDAIAAVTEISQEMTPPILRSRLDPELISSDLEQELKSLITQHRMDCGLPTQWDNNLAYLLGPSLSSYELERREGVSVGVEEFQEAVRRYVPEGHTFKGFPVQFNHCLAKRMFPTCIGSPICSDIIGCRGDNVRLALRVRVWMYPEDVCAVWYMLAVTYRSVL